KSDDPLRQILSSSKRNLNRGAAVAPACPQRRTASPCFMTTGPIHGFLPKKELALELAGMEYFDSTGRVQMLEANGYEATCLASRHGEYFNGVNQMRPSVLRRIVKRQNGQ